MLEAEERDNDRQRDQEKVDDKEDLERVRQLFGGGKLQEQQKEEVERPENEVISESPRSYQSSEPADQSRHEDANSVLSSSIASSYFESQLKKQ